ncbi:MAG: FAD-dependent oxidoreductase [Gemmataceae bacterium]
MKKVVILGAGVVGVAAAHYLRQAGCQVTLVDQGNLGGACSHGNCGYVCPSHVLPHAGPGAINLVLSSLLQRNSPFSVRPRLDWHLFDWMMRFARKCDYCSLMRTAKALHALLSSSRRLYDQLLMDLEADWQTQGLLFVFQTRRAFEHYHHTDTLLRQQFHLGATPYAGGRELTTLEPAFHYAGDAQLRPDRLMRAWKVRLLEQGVTLQEGVTFFDFVRAGGVAVAARTNAGDLDADAFVVATGAWTPLLAKALRVRVPIEPGKGYSITLPRPSVCPRYPLIFEEHRVAVSPFRDALRIGSTMQFAGYDSSIDPRRVRLLTHAAQIYLRETPSGPVEETWWGWRPMVPDGLPIIGPAGPRVWLATGHGMLGLSLATATGKLLCEMMLDRPPHLDPRPYAVTRFA